MPEGGYIKLFRSLETSPDFVGLRADQCWVAVRIMQLANFRPGLHRFRGQAIPVGRGELAHTLETIAERSNSTIKVVRTTVARLIRSGFLGTRTGTVAGTAYRILIVNNYDSFQGEQDETGTVAGTATGSDRAATGHGPGSDRALREEGEEGKKGKNLSKRGAGPFAHEALEHWTQVVWPALAGCKASTPTPHQREGIASLCSTHGTEEVKARMERAAADPFWRQRLTLDDIVDRFDRFAARASTGLAHNPGVDERQAAAIAWAASQEAK